jgi:methionyl-tRNA formyltransferase
MILKNKKIFFFGTSCLAKEVLRRLLESGVEISHVITRPDKPAGRKKTLKPSKVKIFAQKNNLLLKEYAKIDEEALAFFKKEKPDLIITIAYGVILPKELIELPSLRCINIHPSLLPKLRGASPLQTALLNGLKRTGVSIMLMDEKMDHGDILRQEEIIIEDKDNYESLEKKVLSLLNKILIPTLKDWQAEKIKPVPQDHDQASFTKMISKKDGRIDWNKSASEIHDQFRAFNRWPKTYSFWQKNKQQTPQKIIFENIEIEKSKKYPEKKNGEVLQTIDDKIAIKTKSGLIIIKELQLEGKEKTLMKNFVNGYPNFIGTILN